MSHFLDSFEVFDLALGKPPLHCLPANATVREAIEMSKELSLTEISVWDNDLLHCIGVINNLDILCFLASDEHLSSLDAPGISSQVPLSSLVHRSSIHHVMLHDRLSKALELVTQGAQYLIVPLPGSMKSNQVLSEAQLRWPHKDLCWISQEVVMRFLMNCIAAFCPVPLYSIEDLGTINRDFISVEHQVPAIDTLSLIKQASESMTAVAVVQADQGTAGFKLVGDISSSSLRSCDEVLTGAALATLSAADFLMYVHGGSKRSSRLLSKVITSRLAHKLSTSEEQVEPKLKTLETVTSATSLDESSDSEHDLSSAAALASFRTPGHRSFLTCRPWSSLAAVMAQTLSHRSSYIWVTEEDNSMVGIVTYVDMIRGLIKEVKKTGRSPSSQKLFSSTPKLVITR